MQVDTRVPLEDAQTARDNRARTNATTEHNAETSAGAPTERAKAGGPVATSRGENGNADAKEQSERDQRDAAKADERRQAAERELARTLRLPANTRLDIHVDEEKEEVRVLVRRQDTGEVIREVPQDETQALLRQLDQSRGSLVDRSF